MSTAALSNHWEISNDDLIADTDFNLAASGFGSYEDDIDFEYQVQQVADRIAAIHGDRRVRGEFVFAFESTNEGGAISLNGATVAISCTGEFSMYLMRFLDLKNLTADREASGWDQAAAIRDTLMDAYAQVRGLALNKELI